MKLKTIIALALVATFASCSVGLNRKLDKLEEACKDKDLKEVINIIEEIEKKHDEPKGWNLEQMQRFGCVLEELEEELEEEEDWRKYRDEWKEIKEAREDLGEKLKIDCD